jgi:hypothetical protein
VADSQLPATARASAELKTRLLRRKILVLSTREVGAVTIEFQPQTCVLRTAQGMSYRLRELPAMAAAPPLALPEVEEEK